MSSSDVEALRRHMSKRSDHGIVSRCRAAANCRLDLSEGCLCVSLDDSYLGADPTGKRPDFVIAAESPDDGCFTWLLIEMKTGRYELDEIHRQLQGGAEIIVNAGLPFPRRFELIPAVVGGRLGNRVGFEDRRRRLKINLNGVKRTILHAKCDIHVHDLFVLRLAVRE